VLYYIYKLYYLSSLNLQVSISHWFNSNPYYILLVIVKVTYNSTSLLRILVLRIFPITCHMGPIGFLFLLLLCSTLQFYFLQFFPVLFFLSILANFILIVPNTPYQAFCYPNYITFFVVT